MVSVSATSPNHNEAPRASSGRSASFVIAEQEPPAQKHLQPLGLMPRQVCVFKSLVLLPARTLPLVHGNFLASASPDSVFNLEWRMAMFDLRTNAANDVWSRGPQSNDQSFDIDRIGRSITDRQAPHQPDVEGRKAKAAVAEKVLPRSSRSSGGLTIFNEAIDSPRQQRLAKLSDGVQEELNRLHNILRQARYEVVFCDAEGAAVDCRGNLGLADTDSAPDTTERPPRSVRSGVIVKSNDSAASVEVGSQFRIRNGNTKSAVAEVLDEDGSLIGTLNAFSIDRNETAGPPALMRALIQTAARAIEERAFRERHRREWIVAVNPRDASRPTMLFAVDREQSIVAADRNAAQLLEVRAGRRGGSFWMVFEKDADAFRAKQHGDIPIQLVPVGIAETWSALVTPPESKSAPWSTPDNRLHVRPRLDGIGSFAQLTSTPKARGGLSPGALRRVREHVDAHLETKFDLADLATMANLSRCYFARAFKQSTGSTPHRYIMYRRLEKAQQMLAETDLPLAEIALATGFSDQSHFSRQFREHLKSSPSEFRRSNR
jgi:AraC-like DNA-binding protein